MKYRLLNYLICEKCGNPFSLSVLMENKIFKIRESFSLEKLCENYCAYEKKNGRFDCKECCSFEIDDGTITCKECNIYYPIIKSIPRLLKENDLKELFGTEILERYRKIKRYKAGEITSNMSENRKALATAKDYELINKNFEDVFGIPADLKIKSELRDELFGVMDGVLEQKDLDGKIVLDAGCGPGHYDRVFLQMGAKEVIGFDLGTDTIDMAQQKHGKHQNAHFLQGDFFNLPLREKTIDLIISIGVLHHLKDPEKAFHILNTFLKKGGTIFIWVYGKSSVVKVVKMLRTVTLMLPFKVVLGLAYVPATIIYACNFLSRFLIRHNLLLWLNNFIPFKLYLKRSFWGVKMVVQDHLTVPIINFYDDKDLNHWLWNSVLSNTIVLVRHGEKQGRSWRLKGRKTK